LPSLGALAEWLRSGLQSVLTPRAECPLSRTIKRDAALEPVARQCPSMRRYGPIPVDKGTGAQWSGFARPRGTLDLVAPSLWRPLRDRRWSAVVRDGFGGAFATASCNTAHGLVAAHRRTRESQPDAAAAARYTDAAAPRQRNTPNSGSSQVVRGWLGWGQPPPELTAARSLDGQSLDVGAHPGGARTKASVASAEPGLSTANRRSAPWTRSRRLHPLRLFAAPTTARTCPGPTLALCQSPLARPAAAGAEGTLRERLKSAPSAHRRAAYTNRCSLHRPVGCKAEGLQSQAER